MPTARTATKTTKTRADGPTKGSIPALDKGEINKAMREARALVKDEKLAPPVEKVLITPPKMMRVVMRIRGLAPYVQHAFSQKAQAQIEATQRAGTQARSRRTREARDFEAGYVAAQHRSREGWHGIPAPAFRNACIDACRLVGFKMTHAKLSIFIEADGFDAVDSSPLVRITKGKPEIHKGWGRNANGGTDLRWRPLWAEGWEALVTVRWDGDQLSPSDVFNLMSRAGLQVGVGEGRPNSPNSNGLGWGLFEVLPDFTVIEGGKKQ